MKTTRKPEKEVEAGFEMEYKDWPGEEDKTARIAAWENGEGYDVWLGDDKVELTHQETQVLTVLFSQMNILK